MGTVTRLEDYEHHYIARVGCKCGKECVSVVHHRADLRSLECSGCGEMTSYVTHLLHYPLTDHAEWRPLIEEVK